MNRKDIYHISQSELDHFERERLNKHYARLAEQQYPESTFPFIPPTTETTTVKKNVHVPYISPTAPSTN